MLVATRAGQRIAHMRLPTSGAWSMLSQHRFWQVVCRQLSKAVHHLMNLSSPRLLCRQTSFPKACHDKPDVVATAVFAETQ